MLDVAEPVRDGCAVLLRRLANEGRIVRVQALMPPSAAGSENVLAHVSSTGS